MNYIDGVSVISDTLVLKQVVLQTLHSNAVSGWAGWVLATV